jgi:hypothetical protein
LSSRPIDRLRKLVCIWQAVILLPLVFPSRVDFQYTLSDMYGSLNASPEAPSPLFPLPLPPFQTRVDKENASSGSQDLRLYLRMQANRRCYSAHSTTNLDPQQLPRSNETETISPIRNRLPSRPLPSPRLPCSTAISRPAVARTWLLKRRRGLCLGVKTTTSRGFCDAARGASSRSPDHGRCLCGLSTRPTDRPTDRPCWPGAGPGVCAQCGKGFQWVRAIRDPFTPENQNRIVAFWNE